MREVSYVKITHYMTQSSQKRIGARGWRPAPLLLLCLGLFENNELAHFRTYQFALSAPHAGYVEIHTIG